MSSHSRVAKKALEEMDGEFKPFFMTMGDYGLAAVYEAPDDAVAARHAGRHSAIRGLPDSLG